MLGSELVTVDDDTSCIIESILFSSFVFWVQFQSVEFHRWVLQNVDLVGNGSSGSWLITSNHDNFDTGGSALVDGKINVGSWWIVKRNNTNEAKIVHGERSSNILDRKSVV